MHHSQQYPAIQLNAAAPPTPEFRLVNAVLAQAADDLRDMRDRLLQHRFPTSYMIDAALWAASEEHRPMSFIWCCEMVGRDPGVTRKKILGTINVHRLKEIMR